METKFDSVLYEAKDLFEKILTANRTTPMFSLLLTTEGLSVQYEKDGEKKYIGNIVRLNRHSARLYLQAISDEIDEILEDADKDW